MDELIKAVASKVKHEDWINDGDDEWWSRLIMAIASATMEELLRQRQTEKPDDLP